MKRLLCAILGHRWAWGDNAYFWVECRRCKTFQRYTGKQTIFIREGEAKGGTQ